MQTIFHPDAPGYGIFSAQGISLLLCCIVLLNTIHPLSLIAGRAGDLVDALSRRVKSNYATVFRGVDTSSANSLGSGFLLRGEALLPGYAIFFLSVTDVVFATGHHPLGWITNPGNTGFDARITAVAFILALGATAIFDNLRAAWSSYDGVKAASLLNALPFLLASGGFLQTGFNPSWLLSVLASGMTLRVVLTLLVRGSQVYRLGVIAWAPVMFLAWIISTVCVSFLGPLVRVFDRLVEQPGFGGIPAGLPREIHLSGKAIPVPRCYSLDAVPGMATPR